jgi:hypothetical protein
MAAAALRDRRIRIRGVGIALATAVFVVSWMLLDKDFAAHGRISDVPVYQAYGLDVRLGQVPYRDFPLEYPPASLPVFIAPTYVGEPTDPVDYGTWFARLMGLCGLACLGLVILARARPAAIAFVAVSPLLVGYLMKTRFDLWPMVFVTAAVAALLRDRHRLGWLALGWAFAAKLFAVVLIPIAVLWTLRRRGRDELARGIALWLAAVAAVFVPFGILAPHGLWESIWGQYDRPLQIESLPATILTTFGHPNLTLALNSVSIAGHGGVRLATAIVQLAMLAAVWIGFARGPIDESRFVRYSAAAVCAFVAFGKVLSPQYLIWLVPLVPLVRGRRGVVASVLLAAATLETQFWFRSHEYGQYEAHFGYAWLILVRDLMLVALLAILALPRPRLLASPGAPGTPRRSRG